MKNYVCWKNSRTKSPTALPYFILRFKGKLDGEKGSGIVDASIEKFHKKEASIEAEECVTCENYLSSARKKAARLLKSIEQADKKLASIPDESKDSGPAPTRTSRKNTGLKNTAIDNLCEINQEIITVETLLEERIKKLRDKSSAKFEAYISGVRTVISDYHSKSIFNDNAFDIYHKRHIILDNAIKAVVESGYVEKEDEDNEDI